MSNPSSLKPDPVQLALCRFGLGARPGDLKGATADPHGFVVRQLSKPKLALLSDPALPSTDLIFRHQRYQEEMIRRAREANAQAPGTSPAPMMMASKMSDMKTSTEK